MKYKIKYILIVLVLLTTGCKQADRLGHDNRVLLTGSGNLVTLEETISGFDRVETGFSFLVTIHQGEEFSVVLSIDDNLSEYLQVEKRGSVLGIGLKPGYAYDIPQATMLAEVTMPNLVGLRLSGSSHAMLTGFQSVEDFEAELSGSSSLAGDLEVDVSNFSLSGSSYVKLKGSGTNLSIDACGNSVIDLSGYLVEDVALHVSCDSGAVVNVAGRLDVDASQNSFVYYLGQPFSGEIMGYENASIETK